MSKDGYQIEQVKLYRPLQRYLLQRVLEDYLEAYPERGFPGDLAQLQTHHLLGNEQEDGPDASLGHFFVRRLTEKNGLSKLNHRRLYLDIMRPYNNSQPAQFRVDYKYLPLYFSYFDLQFTYPDLENFLQHQSYNLKHDNNQDISAADLEAQLKEFKKIERFQNQRFHYRVYIGAKEGITKGALTLSRSKGKRHTFVADLTIQRNHGEKSILNNSINYRGSIQESGGVAYLNFTTRENASGRASWILSTPNTSLFAVTYATGTFCAIDKSLGVPVAGELLVEMVEEDITDDNFFEKPIPFPIYARFAGKKTRPSTDEIIQMEDVTDLVPEKIPAFAGLYHCYFLSMNGEWLRECIYEISPHGRVRGKLAENTGEEEVSETDIRHYSGKADYQRGHFEIQISNKEGEYYQVFLNEQTKNSHGTYYGLYFGWDSKMRPRAGREAFIPYSGPKRYEKLMPRRYRQSSEGYRKLCETYDLDNYFERFHFSPTPKILNWIESTNQEMGPTESIPDFLPGNYHCWHIDAQDVSSHANPQELIAAQLTLLPDGEALWTDGNRKMQGRCRLVVEKFLYLWLRNEYAYRFAIFTINALDQYTDVITGLHLYVDNSAEAAIAGREILLRAATDIPAGKHLLNQHLLHRIEQQAPGATNYLLGWTDNQLKLPSTAYHKDRGITRPYEFGRIYFEAACRLAQSEKDVALVKRLLNQAFGHNFADIEMLAREISTGVLKPYKEILELPPAVAEALERHPQQRYHISHEARVFRIPFRGRYNSDFIDQVFEEYRKTKEQIHMIGEVAKNLSSRNIHILDKLEDTIRYILEKNPRTEVYRYQTASPVYPDWLERLIRIQRDYPHRFHLYGSNRITDLTNINIILIDPYLDSNTSVIIFTQDHFDLDIVDLPVPIMGVIETQYRDLSDALMKKIDKLKSKMLHLTSERSIRECLGEN